MTNRAKTLIVTMVSTKKEGVVVGALSSAMQRRSQAPQIAMRIAEIVATGMA